MDDGQACAAQMGELSRAVGVARRQHLHTLTDSGAAPHG